MASPIYVVGVGGSTIDAIDPVTLQYTLKYITFPGGSSAFIQDIAFAADGTLYGISTSASKLFRIDPVGDHYEATLIGALGVSALSGFAIDGTGHGYLIALDGTPGTPSAHGELYRVDLATAAVTAIGDTGETQVGDLAFYDGQLYLAGSTVGLATVNISTGATTTIGALGTFGATGLAQSGSALYVTNANAGIGVFDPQTDKLDLLTSNGSAETAGAASTDASPPTTAPQTITGLDGQKNYLVGGNGDDIVFAGDKGDVLVGLGGNDHLFGGTGFDTLYGGTGTNFLAGGQGSDTYYVDSLSDQLSENFDEGNDTVYSSVTFTLSDNVEILRLTGNSAIDGTGNALANTIVGNSAVNVLDGGNGNDTLNGGGGADELHGGAGDDAMNAGSGSAGIHAYGDAGNDTIFGGAGEDVIDGGIGNDLLEGGGGDDVIHGGEGDDNIHDGVGHGTLYGDDGNDTIAGGTDTDQIFGGPGNDGVTIYSLATQVIEVPGEGTDYVWAQLGGGGTYVLPENVENLTISGPANAVGNDLANTIHGSGYANVLTGAGGADLIFGSGGADRYVYLDPTDSTTAAPDSLGDFAHGSDIIDVRQVGATSFSFGALDGGYTPVTIQTQSGVTMLIKVLGTATMSDFLLPVNEVVGTDSGETLKGNVGVDHIQGLGGDDVLYGYEDNDTLDGGTGADTMVGGPGDDTYLVDNPGDTPVEKNTEGTDTVISSISFTLGQYVENLTLTGTGDIDGIGNDPVHNTPNTIPDYSGNNVIVGNAGSNLLDGLGGDDTLIGNDGDDLLKSGAGSDTLLGGNGDDGLYFGASFDASDVVDGGTGFNQLGLQGNYAGNGLILDADSLVNIQQVVLLSGNDARFGDVSGSHYSYALTTVDANVGAGQRLAVSWNNLRDGENVAFNGSAEMDGWFVTFAGHGADHITGGQQDDGFFFGYGMWGIYDTVDGQGGSLDQLGLQGNYTAAGSGPIVFGAGQLAGIEMIVCVTGGDRRFGAPSGQGYSYDLTMNDGNVGAGQTLYISANTLKAADGSVLLSDETLTFDGSAESDGRFVIYSGNGADTIVGGAGNDTIYGGGGADALTGGAGDDVFAYIDAAHSTAGAIDQILDFAAGDSIDLSRIDAVTGGSDDPFAFVGSTAFSHTTGQLRAFQQTPGHWQVEGDVDGDGVADLVIAVTTDHAMTGADFVL